MSRIGKLSIPLPEGTNADIKGKSITIKGKLGTLTMDIHNRIDAKQENGKILVTRSTDVKQDRALHGLTRSLIANMVQGVTEGYSKILSIQGIGYRADLKKEQLVLGIGYSNPVEYKIPADVKIEVDKKFNITISGIDKQRIGQIAAEIRAIRPPDAYKGKGIRYQDEKVRLKEGKSSA